jgi:hypothetical protein
MAVFGHMQGYDTVSCPHLIAVISGVVTMIASLAGEMALMNPTSMPAGQSMST